MIKPGICSVTLAKYSVEEVLQTAVDAKLLGIEWWGNGHVPHGDIVAAERVGAQTRSAGLDVACYGSYYRAGQSEGEGLSFVSVLDTAVALGAPMIRIWAGNQNGINADASYVQAVIDDTLRIAEMVGARGIDLTFEYHGGSLTDRNETAIQFAAQVLHPNVYFSWQPPHGYPLVHCIAGLQGLLPRLGILHVYHWTIGSYEKNTVNETIRPIIYPNDFHRHPLIDGVDCWQAYLEVVRTTGHDYWTMLEFVKDDAPEQVLADAETLNRLVKSI